MMQKIVESKNIILLLILICSFLIIDNVVPTSEVTGQENFFVTETKFIYLPTIYKNFDSTLGTPLFGVQMYGNTSNTSLYHTSLTESGASWLRVPVLWSNIEPVESEPATYNWTSSDAYFAAANMEMGGLNIVGTIDTIHDWAKITYANPLPLGEIIRPDKRDDFAECVAALVERYDGDGIDDAPGSPIILHWEIVNEPDASFTRPKWGNYGAEYANLLSMVYPAVKAANPQAQVLIGGIAYDWFEEQGGNFNKSFLPDVLAAGGGDYFDIMNFHSYPAFATNWTANKGPGLLEKAQAVRAVLMTYGYTKPLVVTEAGWHDNSTPVTPSSPEIQARYVVQLFAQSYAAKLDIMIWWMLYDIGADYPYDTGVVKQDSVDPTQVIEKVSYKTYQEIVAELSTAHFVRKLSASETSSSDLEVYEFVDNMKKLAIFVAWLNPVNTTSSKLLKLSGYQVLVKESIPDQLGEDLRSYVVRDSDDGIVDNRVTITVGGRPLYIELQQ